MKKLTGLFLLFSFILTIFNTQLRAEVKNKSLLGEWVYEVSDAPYGYEKGSLIFAEKDGLLTCVIKLEAGELATSDLKIEDNKISFVTSVDGNPINVALTKEKDKLTGLVDSPEGPKKISAVKK
jgi:hypothetical protein